MQDSTKEPVASQTAQAIEAHRARVMDSPPSRVKPTRDHVLITPVEALDKKHGSILIPESSQAITANDNKSYVRKHDQWATGIVRAVGPGVWLDSKRRQRCDVSVGDVVRYKRAEATQMPEDLEPWTLVLVHEASIAGCAV